MHLKKPWMGGNRALARMSGLCRDKGLETRGQAIVSWSSPQREQQIERCVKSIETLFASKEEA